MQSKPITVAQKLLNLYRQQHVIFGGWRTVNQVFMAEASAPVLAELQNLPTGRALVQHIENLRNGKTPMDSIAPELLPYGGLMSDTLPQARLTATDLTALTQALENFVPDTTNLDRIRLLPLVSKFGDEWLTAIKVALTDYPELMGKWAMVIRTERAYYLWKIANDILAAPISDRSRAQIQADLPEYETYLPMFGDAGHDILSKLRTFVSSL